MHKKIIFILLFTIVPGILMGCASKITYEQAGASYRAGDCKRSFKLLETLARKGDPRAQYGLGYLYYNGLGVPKDEILGRAWIMKAACQQNSKAQCALKILENLGTKKG